MKHQPGPFLRAFVDVAAPIFRAEMTTTRCLNASRVLIDVMHAFKVSAKPVSVQALAINQSFLEGMRKFGHFPQNEEEKNALIAAGGWAIGLDTKASPDDAVNNRWAGHLCVVVQDFLVDPGAIQLHRPEHRIRVPDILVTPITKRFLKGKGESIEVDLGDNARMFYWARNDDRSYEDVSGYQQSPHNINTAGRIANEIADRLGLKHPYEKIDEREALAATMFAAHTKLAMPPHVCEDHGPHHHHHE